MKLSIIIPAYNEEKRIGKTLENYASFFANKKTDFQIIVVLNACIDNTIGVVKNCEKKFKMIKHLDFKKGGKGFAIIEGFKQALKDNSDLMGFVDADMATKPDTFFDIVKNINGYNGIIASRWKKGSIVIEKKSFLRKLYSRGFNMLVRSVLFLNYDDTQCGAKLFKKEAIEKVIDELGITNWAFDIDLLYKMKKHKFKIREITTVWEDRAGSKITAKSAVQMFMAVMRLRIMYSPFRFIVEIYDKLPEKIKIHH